MKKLALVFLALFFGIAKVFAGEVENLLAMQALSQMREGRGLLEKFMESSEKQRGDSTFLCIADILCEQADSSLARLEEVLVARQGQSIVPSLPAVSAKGRECQINNLCIKLPSVPGTLKKDEGCYLCSKTDFNSLYCYKKHLVIAHQVGGWKCRECSKYFVMKKNLHHHVRVHLGLMPYSCPICRCSFKQKSNCKAHIKRHIRNETFGCGYCSKILCTRSSARDHQANFHSGQPEKIEQYQQLSAVLPEPIQNLPGVSSHDSVGQLAVIGQKMCGALADTAQSVQSPGVAPGILPRADNQQAQATGKRCMCLRCGEVLEKEAIAGHTELRHSEQTMPVFYEFPQEALAR